MSKLFVGNLPGGITAAELLAFFEGYGTVDRVLLGKNHLTGRSEPFCFVDLRQADHKGPISRLDGAMLRGRTLQTCEATSPSGWALGRY